MYETYVALSPKLSEVSSYIDQGTTLLPANRSVEGFSRSMHTNMEIVNLELARLYGAKRITPAIKWHYEDWGSAHLSECGRFYAKMPHPINSLRLGICLHEIGHFYLGHMDPVTINADKKIKPGERSVTRQLEIETEACAYAIERMRFYGQNHTPLEMFQDNYLLKIQKDLDMVIEMNKIMGLLEELIPTGLKPV